MWNEAVECSSPIQRIIGQTQKLTEDWSLEGFKFSHLVAFFVTREVLMKYVALKSHQHASKSKHALLTLLIKWKFLSQFLRSFRATHKLRPSTYYRGIEPFGRPWASGRETPASLTPQCSGDECTNAKSKLADFCIDLVWLGIAGPLITHLRFQLLLLGDPRACKPRTAASASRMHWSKLKRAVCSLEHLAWWTAWNCYIIFGKQKLRDIRYQKSPSYLKQYKGVLYGLVQKAPTNTWIQTSSKRA